MITGENVQSRDQKSRTDNRYVDGLASTKQSGVKEHQSGEGFVTKEIEKVTTQLPSGFFLSAAIGAIGISALSQILGRKENAQFFGQWVPTILLLGLYNKIVKLEGSE